ncbi:MAG: VWA domain-containing protein [Planctomycetia bacterium]|nr:VWA domain-containing protein [Planctomycetia bacterium]
MKVRHKPPSLVSMWMLDVFCCALGCVTLLFLLNSRMATDEAKANRTALLDLQTAERKLAAAISALDATKLKLTTEEAAHQKLAIDLTREEKLRLQLTAEMEKLRTQLATTEKQRDDTARRLGLAQDEAKAAQALLDATQLALNAAEKKIDTTAKELATARTRVADAEDLLRKKQKDIDALMKQSTVSATQIDDLQRLLRIKDKERLTLETRLAATKKELTDVEARLRVMQKELDANIASAKAAATIAADELAKAKTGASKIGDEFQKKIDELQKKIDAANVTIIDLQGDKQKLADKLNKIQKDTENLFAGIAMTGRRVVFVVDMSGSMAKRDLQNADETKWPVVVETVCKVMRSIPTLEQYQVIVFSSSSRWLFGSGEWLTFAGEKSVAEVKAALSRIKPQDDTNMYAAFEKAFSLRGSSGLDTIYLFSDGLPTSGPGLTLAQERANPPLKENERGEILGKHVRDTLDRVWNRREVGKKRVKINAVGFYFESPDVGAFLWALARDNDGSFVGMSRP